MPILIFLLFAYFPVNEEDTSLVVYGEKNWYIYLRFTFFTVALLWLLYALVKLVLQLKITLIPERVDSRQMFEKAMEEYEKSKIKEEKPKDEEKGEYDRAQEEAKKMPDNNDLDRVARTKTRFNALKRRRKDNNDVGNVEENEFN